MGLGKIEKRAIFEWLLEKHGLKKKLSRRKIESQDVWVYSFAEKKGLGLKYDLCTLSENGDEIVLGIEDSCCGKHRLLDKLIAWNKKHGKEVNIGWYRQGGIGTFLNKGETLESLAMQYELEKGGFEKARGSKRRGSSR